MIHDIGVYPDAAGPAAALARQVVYLYGSLNGRVTIQWEEAGATLIRSFANRNITKTMEDLDLAATEEEEFNGRDPRLGEQAIIHIWSQIDK
eukprot:9857372-Heterocapsa_arctica.AAC.1